MSALPASVPGALVPLVAVRDAERVFDVSPPWLNRVLERKPRVLLHAVNGVSFDLYRGETLGLVGESGCGKSTVARLLVGLYSLSGGSIEIEGHPVSVLSKPEGRSLRRRVQMIFQDPYASLNPRWRVGRIIAEPLGVHRLDVAKNRAALKDRVGDLLEQVGLSRHDQSKFPHQFSGGQRQRISIARALATEPDFLVCDEPTSALDVSVQAQVLNLMKDLQQRLGLTYLFISHNLAVVRHVADRVGVMYLGKIVEMAPKENLFSKPLHPYTRMLIEVIPDLDRHGEPRVPIAGEVPNPLAPPAGCSFHPRCPFANQRCKEEVPALLAAEGGSSVACHGIEENRIPLFASVSTTLE
jgi:peptide/nickel transport system ATP-binding protein